MIARPRSSQLIRWRKKIFNDPQFSDRFITIFYFVLHRFMGPNHDVTKKSADRVLLSLSRLSDLFSLIFRKHDNCRVDIKSLC